MFSWQQAPLNSAVTEHVNNSGVSCVFVLRFPFSDFSSLFSCWAVSCIYVCMYVPQGLQLSVLFLGFFFLDDLHLLSPFELLGVCLLACFRCFSLQLFLLLFLFFCFLCYPESLSFSCSSVSLSYPEALSAATWLPNFCSIFLDVSSKTRYFQG